MGGWIMRGENFVVAFPDYLAVLHDDASERISEAALHALSRQFNNALHDLPVVHPRSLPRLLAAEIGFPYSIRIAQVFGLAGCSDPANFDDIGTIAIAQGLRNILFGEKDRCAAAHN